MARGSCVTVQMDGARGVGGEERRSRERAAAILTVPTTTKNGVEFWKFVTSVHANKRRVYAKSFDARTLPRAAFVSRALRRRVLVL